MSHWDDSCWLGVRKATRLTPGHGTTSPGAGEQTSHNQSMTGDSPTCLSHSELENSGTLHFPQPQDASASAWCQAAKEDDPSGTRKASRK